MKVNCLTKNNLLSSLSTPKDIIILIIPKNLSVPVKNTTISTVIFCPLDEIENVYVFSCDHPDFEFFTNKQDAEQLLKILIENNNITKWIWNYKKIKQLFYAKNIQTNSCIDINSISITQKIKIINNEDIYTPAHFNILNRVDCNNFISTHVPLSKLIEQFYNLYKKVFDVIKHITKEEKSKLLFYNNKIIESLSYIESSGIYIDEKKFKQFFPNYPYPVINNLIYSEYNLYTKTGRPANSLGGVNFLSLNKHNGMREFIVSRFGNNGMILSVDYSAFHPTIISHLIDYDIKTNIYDHLNEIFLEKFSVSLNYDEIKKIVFREIYGKLDTKYKDIEFFKKISIFKQFLWDEYTKNNFLLTPIFGRKLSFSECNSPEHLFNYYLQSMETEVALYNFSECIDLFDSSIFPILYIYDCFIFDFNINYLRLKDLISKISCNFAYPVKIQCGINYANMKLVTI